MFARSDGTQIYEMSGFVFPRGSLILFAEWYTVAKDSGGNVKPNEGLRLTNQALGHGIAERSRDRDWSGCVADPAIFAEMGRESIYAEIRKAAAERRHSLVFTRANNDRVGGWQKMRDMLENVAADRPEKPGLWVFNTCVNFLRAVPTLQRDENRPDDVDTDQEDHAVDACRYACNSTERKLVEGQMRLG
jgi:hypothetical protein